MTGIPSSVAVVTLILSRPMPNRATIRQRGTARITLAVTCAQLVPMASASRANSMRVASSPLGSLDDFGADAAQDVTLDRAIGPRTIRDQNAELSAHDRRDRPSRASAYCWAANSDMRIAGSTTLSQFSRR